jgi:hypothetical protein
VCHEADSVLGLDRLAFVGESWQLNVLKVLPRRPLDGDYEFLNEAMIARERLESPTAREIVEERRNL